MIVLGLTGSIGMGKSTTAAFFRQAGIPVWDADAAVHRLYAKGGLGVAPIAALRPEAIRDGTVDRGALKTWIAEDTRALKRLEDVIHPLVAQDRAKFLAANEGTDLVVLDIPLLFETGDPAQFDAILVVSIDPETQRSRVLSRPGMSLAQFETILARQMPDAEKRARANHVIETRTLEETRKSVEALIEELRHKNRADDA
ncbi:MAG: dephospho-CoA kinase [Pseudomonadota bacterium]